MAQAGNDVALFTRGDHLRSIQSAGLRIIDEDGSDTVVKGLSASDDLSDFGPQDLVVLALKAHQIAEVAASLPPLFESDTVVMPVQNGIPWWFFDRIGGEYEGHRLQSLDPDGSLARHIPTDRIIASIAYPGADRPTPGVVRVVEGDKFPVGELDGSRSGRAAEIATALTEAGFNSRVLTNIRTHLWVKAWGNLAFNPISALTGGTLAEVCQEPATRALAALMMEEAGAIAARIGIRLPVSIEKRIGAAEAVGDHKTSMLQDAEAGRELELDALVGVFIELGELTGTATTMISAVHALVTLQDRLRRLHR